MKRKAMSARGRKRRTHIRRDPAGRMALAVGDYLKTKGWNVLMTTGTSIEQLPTARKREYRFVVGFVGAKQESQ